MEKHQVYVLQLKKLRKEMQMRWFHIAAVNISRQISSHPRQSWYLHNKWRQENPLASKRGESQMSAPGGLNSS